MADIRKDRTLVIASGASTSSTLTLNQSYMPAGLDAPDAVTGTAFTFEKQRSDGTWIDLEDGEGNAIAVTLSGGDSCSLTPTDFYHVDTIRITSNGTEGAERTFYLCERQVD